MNDSGSDFQNELNWPNFVSPPFAPMSAAATVPPSNENERLEEVSLSPKQSTEATVSNGNAHVDLNSEKNRIKEEAEVNSRRSTETKNADEASIPARVTSPGRISSSGASFASHAYPNPSTTTLTSVHTSHTTSSSVGQSSTFSPILITTALKTIQTSKEARRSQPLQAATTQALELVTDGKAVEKPREVFEPLRLACETGSEKLLVVGLDCIAKLISYGFFVEPNSDPLNPQAQSQYVSPPGSPSNSTAVLPTSLSDLVTHTITSCYTESTPDTVSLQIVKALLQIVLSTQTLVHQSSLLKAVRTVYNIFLLSSSPVTQNIAQGGLTQMVHHVFTRAHTVGGPPSIWTAGGQDVPHPLPSAAQSTFSLSTPMTGTMAVERERSPNTPISTTQELHVRRADEFDGEEVDEAVRAAKIPLPPDEEEGEGEGEQPRFVFSYRSLIM